MLKRFRGLALACAICLATVVPALAGPVVTTETTTALGGSATFSGKAHTITVDGSGQINYITCGALADQTGTLNIQASLTGTSAWYTVQTASMTASTWVLTTQRVTAPYYRCQEVNGSSAQTSNFVQFSGTTD